MTKQVKSINVSRQEYFAPTYELFLFETSDLIQASGDVNAPCPASLGSRFDVSNVAPEEWDD